MTKRNAAKYDTSVRIDLCLADARALQIVLDLASDQFVGGYALLIRDHLDELRETLTRKLRRR